MTSSPSSASSLSGRPSRAVRESQHETSEIMMPQHANNLGHVFGGVVLAMMDKAAAVAATRAMEHSPARHHPERSLCVRLTDFLAVLSEAKNLVALLSALRRDCRVAMM